MATKHGNKWQALTLLTDNQNAFIEALADVQQRTVSQMISMIVDDAMNDPKWRTTKLPATKAKQA